MNEKRRGPPKVSVCVVTYNHERYIRECLQSLVDQKTDFSFEVIVADDCSTDATGRIVREYAEKYPDLVRPFYHQANIGGASNYTFVHAQAEGEYIAHMDGDDYALPGKLQTQADYLDRHPACNIVWHRMKLLNVRTDTLVDDLIDPRLVPRHGYTRSELIRFITIGLNSAKMYRAAVRDIALPGFPIIDYFLNVEQIGDGFASFAGERPLGVYRVGIGVASSGSLTKTILRDSFLHILAKYPIHRRDVSVAASVLFLAALKNKRWREAALFTGVLVRSISPGTVFDIYAQRKVMGMFRFPTEARKHA